MSVSWPFKTDITYSERPDMGRFRLHRLKAANGKTAKRREMLLPRVFQLKCSNFLAIYPSNAHVIALIMNTYRQRLMYAQDDLSRDKLGEFRPGGVAALLRRSPDARPKLTATGSAWCFSLDSGGKCD